LGKFCQKLGNFGIITSPELMMQESKLITIANFEKEIMFLLISEQVNAMRFFASF